MKNWRLYQGLGYLLVCAAVASAGAPASTPNERFDPLLSTIQEEMQRAQSSLWKLDPAPYFLSYSIYDSRVALAFGSEGKLLRA